jgi:hypothetical protein
MMVIKSTATAAIANVDWKAVATVGLTQAKRVMMGTKLPVMAAI